MEGKNDGNKTMEGKKEKTFLTAVPATMGSDIILGEDRKPRSCIEETRVVLVVVVDVIRHLFVEGGIHCFVW